MFFLLIGLIAGIVSGMALGGGVILIAILIHMTEYSQTTLQSINLLFYLPTAIFASIIYTKNKSVDYKIVGKVLIFAIPFAIIGALIANKIDLGILRKMFSLYLILVGGSILIKNFKKRE